MFRSFMILIIGQIEIGRRNFTLKNCLFDATSVKK